MIKLVASDLDGTLLLNRAQELPPEIFPLVRRLKEEGILFIAASGRQYPNMRRLFEPVKDDMAFICENGGVAVRHDELLYADAFPPALVREIAETIDAREGAEFSCSTKDYHYVRPKTQHYADLLTKVVKVDCKFIQSFDEITEPSMKLAVYESGGVTEESLHYWKERFGDRCSVVTSGMDWVDFIPFETNKARGIRKFQEMLGISPEECLAFGDEYNDLEMLKAVTYSVAMAHAKPGVRKTAQYETPRVEPVLEKLIRAHGNIEEVLACIQKSV